MKFSMYDVLLKGSNAAQGKAASVLWKGFNEVQRKEYRLNVGCHYIPIEDLEDGWRVNFKTNRFANYKAAKNLKPFESYGEGLLVFSEKLFTAKWWVSTALQFELGYDFKGFSEKKEAYAWYKQQKGSPDYFDAVIFKMTLSNQTDFLPQDLFYPIEEIMEKKWHNHIRQAGKKQPYILWLCQYTHNLLYHEYIRSGEEDCDAWWGALKDLEEIEKRVKENYNYWVYHLYELIDWAYRRIYDDAELYLEDFK